MSKLEIVAQTLDACFPEKKIIRLIEPANPGMGHVELSLGEFVRSADDFPREGCRQMNWIERKVVQTMVKAVLQRIFSHWHTTAYGAGTTALIIGVLATTYKPHMTWQEWLLAALPLIVGALLKDPGKANQ